MTTRSPLEEVKGVGPAAAKLFGQLGIETIGDLIHYYPRRYDDYSHLQQIKSIKPGHITIKAEIKQITGRYVRRGMHITEAIASDETGSVRLVWFNQPYRANGMKSGQSYFISGTFELTHQKMAIMNPSTERESDFPVNTARIVPIYRETKGLKSAQIRKAVKSVVSLVSTLPETLPSWVTKDNKLMSRSDAVLAMHFPDNSQVLDQARERLGFEELFELVLTAQLIKRDALDEKALAIPFKQKLAASFVSHLPFKLTDDQKRTVWQIYQDMQRESPMNRLVEGDVGSGKTVVATMAALMAMEQGYQVAFMAPTELLARQHAETIYNLLEPLGYAAQVSLLVGSMKPRQKEQARDHIKSGRVRFIVGTHALIQEKVDMHKLGLVIIDEQHRFGVEQRTKLQTKAGHMPHVLSMTATPIPRSLALTVYGELDISIIASKPKDRLPIKTTLISPNSRAELYERVDEQISAGRQVFVVCPLVKESLALAKTKSAQEVHKTISQGPFKHRKVGLLHGQMKGEDKAKVMQAFLDREYDILVATTVIEVGVDVPNATVMMIENADRFGLAQLHQLRGRVGRSQHQGYCYAILSDSQAPSKRLRAFAQTTDGFRLSELDLELRGPGAIYGTFQHGQLDLRIARFTDTKQISLARNAARRFIESHESLLQYKYLAARVHKLRAITTLN
ncbi:ATP-dependent DNA helicase RecG [Candidatus Saccharibacteria bacterium]|nr:MAG: ATP-dependent DNA helicase RecG [Candidatus Saccharibacteria bacterium]